MIKLITFTIKRFEKLRKRLDVALTRLKFLRYQILFGERDDDIYVVTYPKSGTTLMQMMLYQMTTDGNMDFEHIYDVSPWIHNAAIKGLEPKELPSPRIIKSHDKYEDFDADTKGRFIYIQRDLKDCTVSNWHQEISYRTTDKEFDDYVKTFLTKPYSWLTYTMSWLENKNGFKILYLRYEDLLNNFDESVDKIITFLGLDPSKVDRQRVYERTRIEYMKRCESKFGETPTKADKVYNEFIRQGKEGEGKKQFPQNMTKAYDNAYDQYIKPLETDKF